MLEKIKSPPQEVYTITIIVLVGFISFGLGRLSAIEEMREPVKVVDMFAEQSGAAAIVATGKQNKIISGSNKSNAYSAPDYQLQATSYKFPRGGQYVASKNGDKYHFPWCPGAQRISEGNKIWFDSPEAARAAGYKPAQNCKGLE